MGFPRQESWSGLLFPSPGDLPDPETEPPSPTLAGGFFTTKPPGKPATLLPNFNYTKSVTTITLRSSDSIYPIAKRLYPFINLSMFHPSPSLGKLTFYSLFPWVKIFSFFLKKIPRWGRKITHINGIVKFFLNLAYFTSHNVFMFHPC